MVYLVKSLKIFVFHNLPQRGFVGREAGKMPKGFLQREWQPCQSFQEEALGCRLGLAAVICTQSFPAEKEFISIWFADLRSQGRGLEPPFCHSPAVWLWHSAVMSLVQTSACAWWYPKVTALPSYQRLSHHVVRQRPTRFSWKGPGSKYFRLCRPQHLCCRYPVPSLWSRSVHR